LVNKIQLAKQNASPQ